MKPLHLARWIITESKQSLSNLEIQMVLWFLELKHRVEYGKPLLDGDFVIKGDETLSLGIVNMEIYREYRCFGANSIYIDNPMNFKEKMEIYKDEKAGWIEWMDKNIMELATLKYFTLKGVMFRCNGLLDRRRSEKNFSKIKSWELEEEAEQIFGKRSLLRIGKPIYPHNQKLKEKKEQKSEICIFEFALYGLIVSAIISLFFGFWIWEIL